MLVIYQHRIYRQDLRANSNVLYIFGDNLDRRGMGGQAKEMRGEPNAFGIATKRSITHNYPDDFFFDHEPDVQGIVDREFDRLFQDIRVNNYIAIVIPLDGIGTGLARLPENAPRLLQHIENSLKGLACFTHR